jgi:hypothetical protein
MLTYADDTTCCRETTEYADARASGISGRCRGTHFFIFIIYFYLFSCLLPGNHRTRGRTRFWNTRGGVDVLNFLSFTGTKVQILTQKALVL